MKDVSPWPAHAALLVMAKRPSPGQTKTRLTPPFSAAEAAQLYECFLQDALRLACSLPDVRPIIAYSPPHEADYFSKLMSGVTLLPQQGTSLGERLDSVLSTSLAWGHRYVCAMNSDSPTLPAAFLVEAFRALKKKETDVVLGPCEDGGYYLIGWKRPHPHLVRQVTMSTSHVLEDTLAIAHRLKLKVHLLPAWYDVDTAADIARLQADLSSSPASGPHTRQFLAQMPRSA